MLKKDWFIFDAEGDSLEPTMFHCLSYVGKDISRTLLSYDDMRKFLLSAKCLIGHNTQRWDIPELERILGIKIKARLIDTLALSWYLSPSRKRHGLEGYGDDYKIPKPIINDWTNLDLSVYIYRCERDVEINRRLWQDQWKHLLEIYETEEKADRLLRYLEFKMNCARLQEKSGWKLDVDLTRKTLEEFTKEREDKVNQLKEAMPKIPIISKRIKPKQFFNKDGRLTKRAEEYISLVGRTYDLPEFIDTVTGFEDPNPKSSIQVKDWLFSLGWKPKTFKYAKDKETGKQRQIPQISLELSKEICPSIKKLYDKEPKLELLEGLSTLSHRIGILEGFLRDQSNGYLRARIQGLTNTLRFQHAEIVNLPRIDRHYAKEVRGSLICEPDEILVGADMSALEDRLGQHFIWPLDPDYVKSMLSDDWDPHLDVAYIAGMLSIEDVENYKKGDKSKKPIRDIAKNGNYAAKYGAWPPKLSQTMGVSLERAKEFFDAFWKRNWAIKEIGSTQKQKEVNDQRWLFNPVSELWYSLRSDKDVYNTLIQGLASFCFDTWIGFVLMKWPQLTATFHDEGVWVCKENEVDRLKEILKDAINKTNNRLKLNRELDIGIQIGKRYSEIH